MNLSSASILSLFDCSEENKKTFINSLLNQIKDGDVNIRYILKCLKDAKSMLAMLEENEEFKKMVSEAG